MKRILRSVLLSTAFVFALAGCSQSSPSAPKTLSDTGKSEESGSKTQSESGNTQSPSAPADSTASFEPADGSGDPVVYFTSDITPEGLVAVYNKLGWAPNGKVAVKLSTGEPPASNYLRPELIKDLVQSVNGTIVECNTAYGGSRAQNAMHYQVAKDHGFTDIADFKILDEDG